MRSFDHLGNVRAVVGKDADGNMASIVKGRADYYPFGMQFPDKQDLDYRYAYQGQEKDDETGMETFQLRLWDSRLGRWLTPDPAGQYYSPYLGMGNNPIIRIDPDGGKDGEGNGRGWLWRAWNKFKGGLGFKDKSQFGVGPIATIDEWDAMGEISEDCISCIGEKSQGVISKVSYDANKASPYIFGFDASNVVAEAYLNSFSKKDFIKATFSTRDIVDFKPYNFYPSNPGRIYIYDKAKISTWNGAKVGVRNFGHALTAVSVASDSYEYFNGDISGGKYSYRLTGTAASLITASEFGGPVGFAVGGTFLMAEKVHDDYHSNPNHPAKQVQQEVKKSFSFSTSDIMRGFGGQ